MTGPIQVRWISQEDAEYAGERDLRHRILRAPLGMPRGSEENRDEAACKHLVAIDEGSGRVTGCLIFRHDDANRGQLMQMAVDPATQGQGVGRALVNELETTMAATGLAEIYLHARSTAIGFYSALGYAVYGDPYSEVGIPHRHMRKRL